MRYKYLRYVAAEGPPHWPDETLPAKAWRPGNVRFEADRIVCGRGPKAIAVYGATFHFEALKKVLQEFALHPRAELPEPPATTPRITVRSHNPVIVVRRPNPVIVVRRPNPVIVVQPGGVLRAMSTGETAKILDALPPASPGPVAPGPTAAAPGTSGSSLPGPGPATSEPAAAKPAALEQQRKKPQGAPREFNYDIVREFTENYIKENGLPRSNEMLMEKVRDAITAKNALKKNAKERISIPKTTLMKKITAPIFKRRKAEREEAERLADESNSKRS
jgi:hypothetical protein